MEAFTRPAPKPESVKVPVESVYRPANTLPSTSSLSSKIEQAILNAPAPLPIPENEVIDVGGHRGLWANKDEVLNWNGPVPISQYKINYDPHPEVVRKTFNQPVEYNQEISVRYLRPPTPTGGDIVIRQENRQVPIPAPPAIVRVPGERPLTPAPVVLREAPPEYERFDRKEIVVGGKEVNVLPDRKLVIEKLPSLPPKPPQIIIEKWLPPTKLKRRVVLDSTSTRAYYHPTKNLVVQWETPAPTIKRGIKYLGVETADPHQYRMRYGTSLRHPSEMPKFVLDYDRIQRLGDQPISYTRDLPDVELRTERTYVTPTSYRAERLPAVEPSKVELYGDLDALRLLDQATLEREGLTQYIYDTNRNTSVLRPVVDPLGPAVSYRSTL